MKKETESFLKTVLFFTISPGIIGILILAHGTLSITTANEIKNLSEALDLTKDLIILGFTGGMIIYALPSFILGLIYASLELKRTWKTCIFVTLFSPALLYILDHAIYLFFSQDKNIPKAIDLDIIFFLTIFYPIYSIISAMIA